ncbi:MAG: malate dehydrogenase [Mariprofundaceae bacterium]|nr:malate dehydrogenase [Mariprofundaceae bacterium]
MTEKHSSIVNSGFKRKKLSFVGAGQVGATAAFIAAQKELGDIVILDVMEGIPQGKALDMYEASPIQGFDAHIQGTQNYDDTADSDLVVVTAGIARKAGMSRDDLLTINAKIIAEVVKNIADKSPQCTLIIVTNPLDAMVYTAKQVSGFPSQRVIGMAGVLDSARMRAFIAEALDVSIEDVSACVLGGHGDTMLPLPRYSTVAGIPITQLLSPETVEAICQRTATGGAEIVNYLKTGSAFYAPASSIVEMAEAILKDKKRILPCAAYLDGEYGIEGSYLGVPCKLGGQGIESIMELDLSDDERYSLHSSMHAVRELIAKVDAMHLF